MTEVKKIQHTFTILAHWVPFPAPGPPRTNTTRDFATDDMPLTALTTSSEFSIDNALYLALTYLSTTISNRGLPLVP